jgi:SSS family solute:Na+ symporter
MNLRLIDWSIFVGFFILLIVIGAMCGRYVKAVADYVVAGRHMRKFLGLSTLTAESIGLISIAMACQEGFTKGFSYVWLGLVGSFTSIIAFGILGFVIVRYRNTKVMTIAQYFEMRYSKRVRVLAGFVIAMSGVLNMAVFPIVEANFLVQFVGFPATVTIWGITMPSVIPIMTFMIGITLFFTYVGGMVSILVTDFIQSIVIAFSIMLGSFFLVKGVGLDAIHNALQTNLGAAGYSPFAKGSYGIFWLMSACIGSILGFVSFSPNMQKIAATDTAKTAKQMTLISLIFMQGRVLLLLGWGMAALAVMGAIGPRGESPEMWSRIVTPAFIGTTLPSILKGILLAGFVAASISTNDAYFLCWSTTITNDLICTNMKRRLSPQAHIRLFRIVVACVALFIWSFGMIYKPTESILAFISLTGSMFQGVGIAVIGGMYWKRATAAGAFTAIASMCVIPTLDLLLRRIFEGTYTLYPGHVMFANICIATVLYVVVSLSTSKINVK